MYKIYNISKKDEDVFKRKKVCIMDERNLKSLDFAKLSNKKSIIVSTKAALKDVTPINWSEEVLSGKKKILVGQD